MANIDLQLYQQRWQALDQSLDIHQQWVQSLNPTTRNKVLWCLIRRLRSFANDHFNFFYQGFSGGGFAPSVNYPEEHVLSLILYQIADDLDVIRRAVADDSVASTPPAAYTQAAPPALTNPQLASDTLKTADYLIVEALKPAQALGIVDTVAVSYFQRSAAIRVTPYDQQVALIGTPFTAMGVPWDYLAIPHEVGHYVFWNGYIGGRPVWDHVRERLNQSSIPKWVKAWTEEIFADVYGALLAGPIIGLSFQEIQLRESRAGFISDDGEHPVPAIRPDVYSHVMQLAGQDHWAGLLDRRWKGHLDQRGRPLRLLLQQAELYGFLSSIMTGMIDLFGYQEVSITDARREMLRLVAAIYRFFQENKLNFEDTWWSETPGEKGDLAMLRGWFTERIGGVRAPAQQLPDTLDECNAAGIWGQWRQDMNVRQGQLRTLNLTDEPDQWFKVWLADGWATRGPQNSWP